MVHGGLPRWDLGLLEMLYTCVIAAVCVAFWRRKTPVGFYLALVSLMYAPVRFAMDFVRIREGEGNGADLRYGTLTFAQWSCIALAVAGVYIALQVRKGAFDDVPRAILAGAGGDEAGSDDAGGDEAGGDDASSG